MKKFLLVLLLAVFVSLPLVHGQNWIDTAWAYRTGIVVSNLSGSNLNAFQVRIPVDSSFDFSLAKPDGSDLRVTASDGVTSLPFWIETWNPHAGSAVIWTKVPSVPVAGTTLFLYYGNPSAAAASDGNATFDFFDDFAGVSAQGYFKLGSSANVLTSAQRWELEPPHTMSVVTANKNGYKYWGYYGLAGWAYCNEGIGLAFSNDLVNWTKYSGNPVVPNSRWGNVLLVSGVYWMVYEEYSANCGPSYINLARSTDGIKFSTVKTLVPPVTGSQNQNPSLFYNSSNGRYYLYWYSGPPGTWTIMARSATSISGLDIPSTDTVLLTSSQTIAAPQMLYYSGTYFLSTEILDSNNLWQTSVYSSTSPTKGFTLLPGNPVLEPGSACMFQHNIGGVLHTYYCNLADGSWILRHRAATLSAGRAAFRTLDPAKWQPTGGSWTVTNDIAPDGSATTVAQANLSGRQELVSSYTGSDYVFQAYCKQLGGRVCGLGARVSDANDLYSYNLYSDLDSTQNLYVYDWSGWATTLGTAALGPIDLGEWHKLTAKLTGTAMDVYVDDQLQIQTADAQWGSGAVALYGENGTVANFANVLVRKSAAVDPVATEGPTVAIPLIGLAVNPTSVRGGRSSIGTVVLGNPAPNGGAAVALSDNSTSATVPSKVTVPAGATTATFTITTKSVWSTTSATITASYGDVSQKAALSITR